MQVSSQPRFQANQPVGQTSTGSLVTCPWNKLAEMTSTGLELFKCV